jgi:hypothetical protein
VQAQVLALLLLLLLLPSACLLPCLLQERRC